MKTTTKEFIPIEFEVITTITKDEDPSGAPSNNYELDILVDGENLRSLTIDQLIKLIMKYSDNN